MKKINSVILCCLIFLAMMQVYAVEENKLRYEIIFDSCEEHENEVIQKVLKDDNEEMESLRIWADSKSAGVTITHAQNE